ncbi:MAG TPA: class I SAM-dependent methyltransferase [Gaiellaceae bacterium]|nr:class I SAM-dependent methyltransferase [Gaiellaceae bacterium]
MLRRAASRASLRSRERKLRLFLDTFAPGPETSVLDVGVTDSGYGGTYGTDNFLEARYPWPERITAVGVTSLDRFGEAFPQVHRVTADGRALPFADGEFELGFSNAVVEHVGDLDDQRALVRELCRVARRVFVTTPDRRFPLEVHTLLPLVHWLPRAAQPASLDGIRLLGPRAFRELFPYPVRIVSSGVTLTAIGPV